MGRLFFPKQKRGENLLVRVDLGSLRYEFPFHLPGKHDLLIAQSTAQKEDLRSQPQPTFFAVGSVQQTMPTDPLQKAARYLKAAEQGDAKAQFILGRFYFSGYGVLQDYAQSAAWLRRSAEQGDANAQYALGWEYENGRGVPQDYSQAVEWYRKSADQGHPVAQFVVGLSYALGEDVLRNYAQAAAWYRKAAEEGAAKAQFGLGSLYENGCGVQQNYGEAYFWFNLAAVRAKAKDLKRYAKARDEAAAKLTPVELSNAQQRAAEWFAAHPTQQ